VRHLDARNVVGNGAGALGAGQHLGRGHVEELRLLSMKRAISQGRRCGRSSAVRG
jgi:hypothetical protein